MAKVVLFFALVVLVSCASALHAAAPLTQNGVLSSDGGEAAATRAKRSSCRIQIRGHHSGSIECLGEPPAVRSDDAVVKEPREVRIGGDNAGRVCGPGDRRCTVNVGGVDSGVVNGGQPGPYASRGGNHGQPIGHTTFNGPQHQGQYPQGAHYVNAPHGQYPQGAPYGNAPQGQYPQGAPYGRGW